MGICEVDFQTTLQRLLSFLKRKTETLKTVVFMLLMVRMEKRRIYNDLHTGSASRLSCGLELF